MRNKIQINWKKYKILKLLEWGKTNLVLLAENKYWEKVIIKKVKSENNSLQREIDFYWYIANSDIEWFPKLLDYDTDWKTIIMEFKEWKNWQYIYIPNKNWEKLWEDFGEKLQNLHKNKIRLTSIERENAIENVINYFNIWKEDLNFFKDTFDIEKEKLKVLLKKDNEDFVMIHWDFSPHNCLFKNDNDWIYYISTILDPSLRVWYGSKYLDITYLFNTRHNKNKEFLKKWFFKKYKINNNSEIFLQFDKVMKMYLKEIYNLME